MKTIWLLALLSACTERLPTTYEGIPVDTNLKPTCSWGIFHVDEGKCTIDGKRYTCIRNEMLEDYKAWTHVACTPMEPATVNINLGLGRRAER